MECYLWLCLGHHTCTMQWSYKSADVLLNTGAVVLYMLTCIVDQRGQWLATVHMQTRRDQAWTLTQAWAKVAALFQHDLIAGARATLKTHQISVYSLRLTTPASILHNKVVINWNYGPAPYSRSHTCYHVLLKFQELIWTESYYVSSMNHQDCKLKI